MTLNDPKCTRVRPGTVCGVWVLAILLFQGVGRADPPLETFPTPVYSFDLASPTVAAGTVSADDVLTVGATDQPSPLFTGPGLGLGRPGDDLNALSTANPTVSTNSFVLLFSVDRATTGAVAPDPALVAAGVPFNAADQAAAGHAAGDLFMSTLLFTRGGVQPRGSLRGSGNNTLAINNYDEGGRDFKAQPPTSASDQTPGAPEDNVEATAGTSGAARGTGIPSFYFSVAEGSSSLTSVPGLPGDSPADVFFDPDPTQGGNEQVFVRAPDLGLQPVGDDIDSLLVFDMNTNGRFDPGDQVLFSLAPGSITLSLIPGNASPADVFSVVSGAGPVVVAGAGQLGLNPADDLDCIEFLLCTDAVDCAQRFGIRAPSPSDPIPTVSEWGVIILALSLIVAGTIVVGRRRPAAA